MACQELLPARIDTFTVDKLCYFVRNGQELHTVADACEKQLVRKISVDNVFDLLALAEDNSCALLRSEVIKFVGHNWHALDEKYFNKVLKLSREQLRLVVACLAAGKTDRVSAANEQKAEQNDKASSVLAQSTHQMSCETPQHAPTAAFSDNAAAAIDPSEKLREIATQIPAGKCVVGSVEQNRERREAKRATVLTKTLRNDKQLVAAQQQADGDIIYYASGGSGGGRNRNKVRV